VHSDYIHLAKLQLIMLTYIVFFQKPLLRASAYVPVFVFLMSKTARSLMQDGTKVLLCVSVFCLPVLIPDRPEL